MRAMSFQVIGVVVIAAFLSGPVEAQKGKVPQGRPFQLLRDAIFQTEQALVQQIEGLQAQLEANAANDTLQSQLISALQTLASQLESKLSETQATVSELAAYNALQEQLLQQQLAQVAALQSQALASQTQLFQLYQAQQSALATLSLQIDFLTAQSQVQATDLAALSAKLTALKSEYDQTAAKLATGCAANSSIRQLTTSTVVCEADSTGTGTTGTLQGAEFVSAEVTAAPGTAATVDVFCTSTYVATGGGVSSTLPVMTTYSIKLPGNGWRVKVHNPNANNAVVQARVACVRLN